MRVVGPQRLKRFVALLLSFLLLLSPIWSQESGNEEESDGVEPIPYSPDEFPGWAHDLRRGEIIALGSFPVALILTNLGYRLGKFTVESVKRGEFAQEYAPAFTTPEQRAGLNDQQQLGLILTAGAISIGVALADYLLGRREERRGPQRE
jgi:hypothetical protein